MKVAQLLKGKPESVTTVSADTPVPAVVAMLKSRGIGAVVVVDGDGNIAGILSERDIVGGLSDRGAEVLDACAGDLMTAPVQTCRPGHDVTWLMRTMTERRFRHIPVVDNGKMVGIVSIGDAVKARIQELEQEAEALQSFIAG